MTSLGFPGLSSQSVSGLFGPFRPENPKMDCDDKPGLPRVVILVRFGFLFAFFGQKAPKRTGMTSLGFPGLSSQGCHPRVVIPDLGTFWTNVCKDREPQICTHTHNGTTLITVRTTHRALLEGLWHFGKGLPCKSPRSPDTCKFLPESRRVCSEIHTTSWRKHAPHQWETRNSGS